MRLAFDEVKATQAAAMFLRLAGSTLSYMALIKLLYRADREALRSLGLPITTDTYSAMRLGPVTSTIYDRIKASANPNVRQTFWSTHVKRKGAKNLVTLERDPGSSELSPAEEAIVRDVFAVHGTTDRFKLAKDTHKEFPEWSDPGNHSVPIEISEIIAALNLTEAEAAHIESLIDAQRAAQALAT